MKFTVLLLVPDYLADEFGKETFMGHVEAPDAKTAQSYTQAIAAGSVGIDNTEDFAVLLVIAGHHDDVSQP